VLKTRNSILRDSLLHKSSSSPQVLLDALDEQCALYGLLLMEKRETAVSLFCEIFTQLFEQVSGIAGMAVQYSPSWKGSSIDDAMALLQKRRPADMGAGVSLSGPHRDRYMFALGASGQEFAANASTGQRRLLALLLRVAQARRYFETTGRKPILLLDDVLLEMDGEKRRRFLSVLPEYDQAFFTFLPEEPFHLYRKDGTLVYFVRDGRIEE
jgi:DNA replication and repair protein RecF